MRAWLISVLPRGHALSDSEWKNRHRVIVLVLWLHVGGAFAFGLWEGFGVLHVLLEASFIGVAAVWATSPRGGRTVRTLAACFGLIASSAVLVHLSGGYIEMHFHFFIMLSVIALYQEWLPFLLSIAFVAAHHGIVGAIDPNSVYNDPAAVAHPWLWLGFTRGLFRRHALSTLLAGGSPKWLTTRPRAVKRSSQRLSTEVHSR